VEISHDEAVALVATAGFDITSCRGVWLCPPGVPLDAPFDVTAIVQRAVLAASDPRQSFVWWLEARKGTEAPESQVVQERAHALFDSHWHRRVHRAARRADGTLPESVSLA